MIHPLRGQPKPTKPEIEEKPAVASIEPMLDYKPTSKFECRMYENTLPEPDSCVMVNVRQITDVGTYVQLLEYNNIEGMILLSELTRRRIRYLYKDCFL
jgi:hypothetical protein